MKEMNVMGFVRKNEEKKGKDKFGCRLRVEFEVNDDEIVLKDEFGCEEDKEVMLEILERFGRLLDKGYRIKNVRIREGLSWMGME